MVCELAPSSFACSLGPVLFCPDEIFSRQCQREKVLRPIQIPHVRVDRRADFNHAYLGQLVTYPLAFQRLSSRNTKLSSPKLTCEQSLECWTLYRSSSPRKRQNFLGARRYSMLLERHDCVVKIILGGYREEDSACLQLHEIFLQAGVRLALW